MQDDCLGLHVGHLLLLLSGTSADAQLAVFALHKEGGSRDAALRAVTDWIAQATLQ